MNTFEEYQTAATQLPLSLRNNLDRIRLPVTGLQEEAGKISSLLTRAVESGRFVLTPQQRSTLQGRLGDVLWYLALLCEEAGFTMQEVAVRSATELQERAKHLDPDRR